MSRAIEPLHHRRPRRLATALTVLLLAAWAPGAHADDLFIESDDYEEGEEIVSVFLQDEHYRIMVEDLERRGQDFDWGWALSERWEERRAADKKIKPKSKVKALAFDLADYGTVRIPEVENFAGIIKDDELAEVRDAYVLAAEQLGLEVVDGGPADLELAVAIVDVNREGGGFGPFKIDPFIEMEFRLRELGGGERDLLLVRHQKHSETPGGSALETANMLTQFMR
ncbi:MAG: hypothetical protein ACOC7L_04280 [Acidobacteriota bacterium]